MEKACQLGLFWKTPKVDDVDGSSSLFLLKMDEN
jgi:hypothetical protein